MASLHVALNSFQQLHLSASYPALANFHSQRSKMPLVRTAELIGMKLHGLAPRACELCRSKEDMRRCSGCHSVYYCGRDCETDNLYGHKITCESIKKARLRYELEEEKLRDRPGDASTSANLFEDQAGHFWSILETRPYMRARYGLVEAMLLSYGTAGGHEDVVQMALDHLLDMLRLCRGDNMGVRDLVPALYIRLGRDQDAYDFMKWFATTGAEPFYDWGSLEQPFLDVKNADVLEEPVESWTQTDFMFLSHAAALTLIKVRVLLDLQAIQNARIALRGSVPQEIIDMICRRLVGNTVGSRHEILLAKAEETTQLIDTIKSQIRKVYRAVWLYNPYFWRLLVEDPDAGVLQRPTDANYSTRTKGEALTILGYSFASWYETPGAVDVLRSLGEMPLPYPGSIRC